MAISVTRGNLLLSAGPTPVSPNIPASSQAGDYLVCFFASREATDGTVSISAGWDERVNNLGAGGLVAAWTRAWESGDANPTLTTGGHDAGDSLVAVILRLRPTAGWTIEFVDASTPSHNAASSTTVGPIDGDTLTVANNGIVFVLGHHRETWTSVANLSGDGLTWAEAAALSNSLGDDNAFSIQWALSDNVAITDKSFTITGSGGAATGAGFMLFLKESLSQIIGQASTSGTGSVAPASSKAISGSAATSAIGSVSHGGFASPLSGQVITLGQGLFDDQSGQIFFSGQGTLAPVLTPPGITGQSITSAQGVVTVSQTTGNVTVHLNTDEQFIQSFVGSVLPRNILSGQASTSAAGTATPLYTVDLVGSVFTASQGMLASGIDAEDTHILSSSGTADVVQTLALLGQEITGGHGTVSTTAIDKEDALFGLELVAIETSSVLPSISIDLAGEGITASQFNVSAPGFAELSGQVVLVEQGFFGRELEISGAEITSAQGSVTGLPGIVALVGDEVSVQQGSLTAARPATQWTAESDPTTPWTPTSGPASSWTKRSDPSTPWTRKT
jgi:hypothetical protein